jgi:galactokinase
MNTADLISIFHNRFGYTPSFIARAPGRVNLIGEHTDYNDGFVLPMAIDRDVTIVGAPRNARTVRLYSANFDERAQFSLAAIDKLTRNTWSNYARGVADVLQKEGYTLNGFDGVVFGLVPIGSGLSSSAATEMATMMAFKAAGNLTTENTEGTEISKAASVSSVHSVVNLDGVTSAKLSQRAENQFVGVNCGIMDQFISSLGQAGHALLIDCRSLDYELLPMPPGVTVLVVDSSAPRSLAASAYNERRAQCEHAATVFGVEALRDVSVEEFERRKSELPDDIARRVSHVIYENRRVLDAVAALRANDVARFGELMNQSHDSLRDLYEVSSRELDAIVDIARGSSGVYGARMTGAGFGGCAIALVQNDQADALAERMLEEYPRRTGREPKVYSCVASDGACWWAV